MAESPEDKAVDTCIIDIQAALDKLKAAQKRDVADESGDTEEDAAESRPKPRNLKQAGEEAYIRVRAHNRRQAAIAQSGKPDPGDDRG